MKRKPRRLFRGRRVKSHPVRVLGVVDGPDGKFPLVEVSGDEGMDQMDLDRLIEDSGLDRWIRAIRPDDLPDPAHAVDPGCALDGLVVRDEVEAAGCTHVMVHTVAPGVRARIFTIVHPLTELN